MKTLTKFYLANDPKIDNDATEEWFRNSMQLVAIEEIEGSPSAFFIMEFRPEFQHLHHDNLQIVVKHKVFNKTHFANYDLANELITKVKSKTYKKKFRLF